MTTRRTNEPAVHDEALEQEVPTDAAIREARVELVRRNPHWTELEETALVPRARLLVHADSDEVFTLYRGVVFGTGAASILFNEQVPMWFYVDRAGEVVFLERRSGT